MVLESLPPYTPVPEGTRTDASGYSGKSHPDVHNVDREYIRATVAKLGLGPANPFDGAYLAGTGDDGESTWLRFPFIDPTNPIYAGGVQADGSTDDDDAWHAAMDAADDAGGGTILVPVGTSLSGPLTARTNVTLYGMGIPTYGDTADVSQSTIKLKAGSNDSLITVPHGVRGFTVERVALDGNKANNSGTCHGVEIEDSLTGRNGQIMVVRCWIHDFTGTGVYSGAGNLATTVEHNWIWFNDLDGVYVGDADCRVRNNSIGVCGRYGVNVYSGPTTIEGGNIFKCLRAINVETRQAGWPQHVVIADVWMDRNQREAIYLGPNVRNTKIVHCQFNGNSYGTTGAASDPEYQQYAHIKVDATSATNSVVDSTFYSQVDGDGLSHVKYDIQVGSAGPITVSANSHLGHYATALTDDATKLYAPVDPWAGMYGPSGAFYAPNTWIPSISFTTQGDFSPTYSVRVGYYTRVGRLVTCHFRIRTSSFTHTTASGNLYIGGGFPAMANIANLDPAGAVAVSGWTKAGYTQVGLEVNHAAGVCYLRASGSGQAIATLTAADMPSGGTVEIAGSFSYIAA